MIRVLIVDDDDSIRELMSHKFNSELNIVVTAVSSGNEAIARLDRGEKFCLIVSDYNMTNGNGADLLEYVTAKNLKAFFIFFTSESHLQIPKANKFFLGTINKTDPSALMKEVKHAINMAPAYF